MDFLIFVVIILVAAIFTIFSKEWGDLIKKIIAKPLLNLVLSLTLVTLVIVSFETWIHEMLLKIKAFLHTIVAKFALLFPFPGAESLGNILLLMLCTLLSIMGINFWFKRKFFESGRYALFAGLMIWILVTFLLTVNYGYSIS